MRIWKHIFISLFLTLCLIWLSIFSSPDKLLHLVACDVGQGDATIITYGNLDILIDGGPNSKVIDCLGRHLPFWDREIEVVILTHPDSDHYSGLIEVFKRYKIDRFLTNGLNSSNQSYKVLESEVGGRGIREVVAKKGTGVRVGKIHLDIVHPSGELITENLKVKSTDTNDFSLVILLKYDQFEALLTGDAPKEIINTIAVKVPLDYLKLSHHGSKTGTDDFTLNNFMPKLAVISVGKNNYGHPDEGVLKILGNYDTKILRTDEIGDIDVESDGEAYWLVK